MIKGFVTFLILFLTFFFLIGGFRSLSFGEKMFTLKTVGYAIIIALISVATLATIVILF